jgi:hypothetical protein
MVHIQLFYTLAAISPPHLAQTLTSAARLAHGLERDNRVRYF